MFNHNNWPGFPWHAPARSPYDGRPIRPAVAPRSGADRPSPFADLQRADRLHGLRLEEEQLERQNLVKERLERERLAEARQELERSDRARQQRERVAAVDSRSSEALEDVSLPEEPALISQPPRPVTSNQEALQKALADLAAAEVRVERDARRIHDETRAGLVKELLPVLDNLDRTLFHASEKDSESQVLVQGVQMVRNQLEQVLLRYGVERVPSIGEKFDPALHEAVAMMPVLPDQIGLVVQEAEAGYRFGGKVMRAAKVVVGRAADS